MKNNLILLFLWPSSPSVMVPTWRISSFLLRTQHSSRAFGDLYNAFWQALRFKITRQSCTKVLKPNSEQTAARKCRVFHLYRQKTSRNGNYFPPSYRLCFQIVLQPNVPWIIHDLKTALSSHACDRWVISAAGTGRMRIKSHFEV